MFEGLTPSPCGHSPYLICDEQRGSVDTLMCFLCCGYFFNPSVTSCRLLYILRCKTPRNATRHGWGEVEGQSLLAESFFFAFMLRRRSKKFKRILNILPSIIFNCAVKKLSLCPEEKKGYELTISKPCQRQ